MLNKNNLFDTWNNQKKQLHAIEKTIGFSVFEIVFIRIGSNVGYEQDGKGEDFLRPVLVYKKFNNRVFLGIPLTSVENNDKFHFGFEYKKGIKSYAILSQVRLFDIKRAKYKDGKISKENFKKLQEKMLDLIVTPLEDEGERTEAICRGQCIKRKIKCQYFSHRFKWTSRKRTKRTLFKLSIYFFLHR